MEHKVNNIEPGALPWESCPSYLSFDAADSVALDAAEKGQGVYSLVVALLVFGYTFCAVGLRGIPTLSRSGLVSAVCLWTVLLEGIRCRRIVVERWIWYPLSFWGYLALSALWARVFPLDSLGNLVTVWGGSLAVTLALRNGISWKVPVYALLLAGSTSVVAYLLGINYSATPDAYYSSAAVARATGLMGNANVLAMSLGLPAFLIFLVPNQFSLVTKVFSLFLAVYGAVITGSRKGGLLVICLVTYTLFRPMLTATRFRYLYLAGIVLVVGVVSSGAIEVLSDSTEDVLVIRRVQSAFEGRDSSFLKRLALIRESDELFWRHPFVGHGLDMYRHVSRLGGYAHNNYCELMVDGGILAILLFYAMHYRIIRYSSCVSGPARGCLWFFMAYILVQDMAVVSYPERMTILALMMVFVRVCHPDSVDEWDTSAEMQTRENDGRLPGFRPVE